MAAGSTRRIFFNERGLRIGWGIALFIAIAVSLRFAQYFGFTQHLPDGWLRTPQGLLAEEVIRAAIVLFATFVLARVERRAFGSYGLGGNDRLRLLLKGSLWGFAAISVVLAMQWLCGNIALTSSAGSTLRLIGNGVLWLAAFYAVAVFEELLLRGYPAIHAGTRHWLLVVGIGVVGGVRLDAHEQPWREPAWAGADGLDRVVFLPCATADRVAVAGDRLPRAVGLGRKLFLRRAEQRPVVRWTAADRERQRQSIVEWWNRRA
jgi:hypothetical protein